MTTAPTIQVTDYGKLKAQKTITDVEAELRFTETYRATEKLHPYLREVECLKVQTLDILVPNFPEEGFAGKLNRRYVGIDPERGDLNEAAYFCQFTHLQNQLNQPETSPELSQQIQSLIEFWSRESTYMHCRNAFPAHLQQAFPSDDYYLGQEIAYPMFGLGGPCLHYDKLLQLGLSGLKKEIEDKRAESANDACDPFLEACIIAIDIVRETALRYAEQADAMIRASLTEEVRKRQERIRKSLLHIADKKPETLHQAIQLFWLYNLISLTKNYGRMDVYLGDFLNHDLAKGTIHQEEAKSMLMDLWKQIDDRGDNFNNRIIVGGKGRRNENNANQFTRLALEVQGLCNQSIPQLSVRWHEGMPQDLWQKSLEVIGNGTTFPILYNDDVNVPAVADGLEVSIAEAEQYVPYGCGEYVIDHASLGSPDAALNVTKALEVTLFDGLDTLTGTRKGLAFGNQFSSFEELKAAFARQIDFYVAALADAQDSITRTTSRYAAFPLLSILYDDCIARGLPALSGGVRYMGGTLESFGNNTTSDALFAIKTLVFEKKTMSLETLRDSLFRDFKGREREQKELRAVPKFGNDHAEADALSLWVNELVCRSARNQRWMTNLHHFSVVMINNGDNVTLGKGTGASADGRNKGMPLSNGNQPGAGYDNQGITALLNSMAKLNPALHAGATHNLKFSRNLFRKELPKISSLLKAYFQIGGTQAMITVTDRRELELAMMEPEKYSNLIVRVGGYSERFIDLPRDVQLEVIRRTLY